MLTDCHTARADARSGILYAGRGRPLARPCANCGARPGEKCFWHCTARPTKRTNNPRRRTDPARRSRTTAPTLLLAACALGALSGCTDTLPHTPAQTARPSHAATPPDPTLTGSSLQRLLPTAGMFTAGITVTRTTDTGASWIDPAHLPAPALPAAGCEKATAISASMFTADYRAAAATETIAVGNTTVQVLLEATNPGDAARQIAEDTAYAQRCAQAGLTLDSFADLGDKAIRIRVASPTDPHAPEVELVRVGDVIAAISDTDLARDESVTASVADYLAHRLA